MAVPSATDASGGSNDQEEMDQNDDQRSKVSTPVSAILPRSVQPFRSGEEYIYAMKEDLAEWLQSMYEELQVDVDTFFEALDTGVLLCRLANHVLRGAREGPGLRPRWPRVTYRTGVRPGTFQARDNISQFIGWCRGWLRVKECLLFETDDLVERKNERNVVLCLLEVARRGCDLCESMPAPLLVQMEREIDAEVARDLENGLRRRNLVIRRPSRLLDAATMTSTATLDVIESSDDGDIGGHQADEDEPSEDENPANIPQVIRNDLRSLHQRVASLLNMCTCPTQFPMLRVADGKYRIGDTQVLIFVRVLRNHVMVRVGGGWDTLDHYLEKHDPCRGRTGRRLSGFSRVTGANTQKMQSRPRSCGTPTARTTNPPFVSPPTSQRRRSYDFSSRLSSPDDGRSPSLCSSRTPSRGSSPRAGSLHEEDQWQGRRSSQSRTRQHQSDCSSSEVSEEGDHRWRRSGQHSKKSSPKKMKRFGGPNMEESEVDSIYSSPPRSLDSYGRRKSDMRPAKSPSLVSDDSAVSLDTLARTKTKASPRSKIPKSQQPSQHPQQTVGRPTGRLKSSRSEASLISSHNYSPYTTQSLRERTPPRGRKQAGHLPRSSSGSSPFIPAARRSLSSTRPSLTTPSREYRPVVPAKSSAMDVNRRTSANSSCQSSPGKPVAPLLEEILQDSEILDTDEKLLRRMEQLIDEYRCRGRRDDFDDYGEDATTACFSLSLDDEDASSLQSLVVQSAPIKSRPSSASPGSKASKIPVFTAWQVRDG